MNVYGHLWGTDETRALFDDDGRTRMWLEILGALAQAQGGLGVIPVAAAEAIAARVREPVDLAAVARETRATGHSTLGLIRVLQRELPGDAREWVYYGATVQDVSDTWTGLVARRMLEIAERDLGAVDAALARLAAEHRDTVMLGRTHGQPGLPITFGYKAAVWLAEVRRHRERVAQARPRLVVGQLAGAVGTLSAWGSDGLELQRRVLGRLGLGVPEIPWTSARDRPAEFVALLALVTATLAKVGNEIANLQRPEIGEVAEAPADGVVGSITMPQKHNPERSEHLVTLGRVVRSSADLALEGVVGEHERDGASWKTEWELLPRACGAAAVSLRLAAELLGGLRVDTERMRANVDAQDGYVLAEPVMLALGEQVGPRRAHELVHAAAARGLAAGMPFRDALEGDPDIPSLDLDALLRPDAALGAARELVDRVLDAGASRAAPDPGAAQRPIAGAP
ncbi:MAG TPA: adenylosuccinate lyase family protein [Solirubrobacteraceae bacterium]|nr:adenylosuccinate lyase family protein [Solirubrobacteraceae bacterium]